VAEQVGPEVPGLDIADAQPIGADPGDGCLRSAAGDGHIGRVQAVLPGQRGRSRPVLTETIPGTGENDR
jgi:hypothetical protein